MNINISRRKFLKSAGLVFFLLTVTGFSKLAGANTNRLLRDQLKYQNTPKDKMSCTTCLEFTPGKNNQDAGRCKVIPDDDEISPNGYCTRWNTM